MRLSGPALVVAALLLSGLGGALKIYGGARHGSRAVLVDGITCVANLAAGLAVLLAVRMAETPPDLDHPFGHRRFVYTGILATIIAYSVAAGFSMALLLVGAGPDRVDPASAGYALLGGAAYAGSIALLRRAGPAGRSLSMFTFSEVLESGLSAAAALLGATVSSLVDVAGAWVITGYIFYEILEESRGLNRVLVDWAHPSVYREIRRLFEARGLRVESLRLRLFEHGRYHGDAVIRVPRGMPRDVALLLVEEARDEARQRYNAEVTVQVRD